MAERPIKLTIAALGGQGGGVLADWLIEIAEAEAYIAQSTSVPGVAQRTGATIYYLEILPARCGRTGRGASLSWRSCRSLGTSIACWPPSSQRPAAPRNAGS